MNLLFGQSRECWDISYHFQIKLAFVLQLLLHGWQVKNVTGDTADTFLEYIQRNIPEGVSMGVEQTALESLPDFFELPAEAKTFLDEQKSQSKKTELPAV